jgi:tetratricopeptide (TPR) repeat protein
VLAFTDMSAAKDQDWFCDGIAEEILNALAPPLDGLRVAARTSAFSPSSTVVTFSFSPMLRRSSLLPLNEAAKRSIELNPTSAVGHTALACATLLYENNRAAAKQEFERALELNPHYAQGRSWYALHYLQWARGDYERGIAEAQRALASDPLSAYVMMILGACLYTAGRLDEAIDMCRRAVRQDAESFVAQWALGISLGLAGRFPEAVSTLEAAGEMSGRHCLAITALAGVLGHAGRPDEARALHHELMDRASRGYVSASHMALTAEAAGDREEAMAFARRAWDEREPPFILWARHFAHYRTLHSDPRFAAILREMNEPDE